MVRLPRAETNALALMKSRLGSSVRFILCSFAFFISIGARAEIIVQDNFERPDGSCGATGSWSQVFNLRVDGTKPHAGGCSAWHQYIADEDSAYLRHNGAPTPRNEIHGIYWVYYSDSGSWPRHQKMNRFYIGSDPSEVPHMGIMHPYGNGSTRQSAGTVMPEVTPIPAPCVFIREGQWTTGRWHKVEFYAKINGGCSSPGSCAGCNDIKKIWVDDVLVVDGRDINLTNGVDGLTFTKFWLFGNSSNDNSTAVPPFKTIYMDDICIATTAQECGGLAGGGVPTDTSIPPPVTGLHRTDTTTP